MDALRPRNWPVQWRWLVLVPLSLIFAVLLEMLRLPAALLLGPMAAAILLASQDGTVRIAPPVFVTCQGIVGAMIAVNLPVSIFPVMVADWPVFLLGTLSTLLASSLLGWILSRSGALPGTTAIWGSAPGAATVMTLMSEQFGADMRLVAFMQYMRVVACAVVATLVSRFIGHGGGSAAPHWVALPAAWLPVATAIAVALIGAYAGVRLKIPGGAMLTPMILGMMLKLFTPLHLDLPPLILAASYAVVGWAIGMRFSASVLRYAKKVFLRVVTSILALILICCGFGAILMLVTGVDPLTAYLATSPGGADSVAIIAASSKVNMPFVMTMQIARFLCVLIVGPAIARLLSKTSPAPRRV
ncbi:AbrB family transcriptional regulator [Acidisoma cellulosilytica]|uniref:AbrB family transcriptional regulator n=1 Tax=Acidisoma cellulosilyticum TaxID=2802395 RepID=A0A964E3R0_9PROT|nr:AbrB family transcriptional regulator [Acidisoma cellulosilyticum]